MQKLGRDRRSTEQAPAMCPQGASKGSPKGPGPLRYNERRLRTQDISLQRVAAIAAETGARFVRERILVSALAWLTTEKALLDGLTPIDACRSVEGFRRVAALHELSLGLDGFPEQVEGYLPIDLLAAAPPAVGGYEKLTREAEQPGLYTCSVAADVDDTTVHIFAAMIARDAAEVRKRLRWRYGPLIEDEAIVTLGFDPSEPLACAMISDAIADILSIAADDPDCAIARGLDVHVEQRFTT